MNKEDFKEDGDYLIHKDGLHICLLASGYLALAYPTIWKDECEEDEPGRIWYDDYEEGCYELQVEVVFSVAVSKVFPERINDLPKWGSFKDGLNEEVFPDCIDFMTVAQFNSKFEKDLLNDIYA